MGHPGGQTFRLDIKPDCFEDQEDHWNKKIGHAGSLDPMATGLLVLALGKATKLLGKGLHGAKTYLAVARIAAASSTWDCDSQRKVIFYHHLLDRKRSSMH